MTTSFFTEGNYYSQTFANGDEIYLLVGPVQKNGAHKAIKIENIAPRAVQTTTNFLHSAHWTKITAADIRPNLYQKLCRKAEIAFGA